MKIVPPCTRRSGDTDIISATKRRQTAPGHQDAPRRYVLPNDVPEGLSPGLWHHWWRGHPPPGSKGHGRGGRLPLVLALWVAQVLPKEHSQGTEKVPRHHFPPGAASKHLLLVPWPESTWLYRWVWNSKSFLVSFVRESHPICMLMSALTRCFFLNGLSTFHYFFHPCFQTAPWRLFVNPMFFTNTTQSFPSVSSHHSIPCLRVQTRRSHLEHPISWFVVCINTKTQAWCILLICLSRTHPIPSRPCSSWRRGGE